MKNLWAGDGTPNWEAIEEQEWFKDMLNCPQDPIFHAEGDVGVHTKMVVEALMGLEEFQLLETKERSILLWAALLHDIAKPMCTITDEEGYIRAPKHAEKGAKYVRQLFWNIDFDIREQICALIRLHGLPIWCLDKPNPYRSVALASLRLNNQHLYLLAKADVLGRISKGQDDFLMRVELYKEFCIEQECWTTTKAFYNEHSQFKFFFKEEQFPAIIYDDTSFEVIVLSGMPGSGKDTYAESLKLPVISLDAIREEMGIKHSDKSGQGKVAQEAYQRAKVYCAKKQSFVWNSTNLTRDLRQRIIRTLSVYNPRFKLVYIETAKEKVYERRKTEIPVRKLDKMFKLLELPLAYEVHEIVYLRN